MKRAKILIIIVLTASILACGSGSSIATVVIPKSTDVLINIITPTLTDLPSNTPTNTITPSITPSPTATYTATPIPPATLTQLAIEATQTKKAGNASATQSFKSKNATATAEIKTKVAEVKAATATEVASYDKSISWKEISTYADNYAEKKVSYRGRIFNINGKVVQLYFSGTYEALYVEMKDPPTGIYEDDSITVYGIVYGKYCFTNAMNSEVCQPALYDAWYTKP